MQLDLVNVIFTHLLPFYACAFATRHDKNRLLHLFAVFPSEQAVPDVSEVSVNSAIMSKKKLLNEV